jgi:DNA (cytosine-5)-methyltransferase 1
MNKKNKKLNTIDLFAGCGGLTEGFEQTGFYSTVASVEWDKSCCKTLANRLEKKWGYKNAWQQVLRFDIQRSQELFKGWKEDPSFGSGLGLDSLTEITNGKVDLIIGGPPCQAYSLAGRIRDENGMENDYRNYLFEKYIEVVKRFKPFLTVFENVPGMLSAAPGGVSIVDRVKEAFSKAGYDIIEDIKGYAQVEASDYGVPQFRKRLVIIGLKKGAYKKDAQEILKEYYTETLPSYKSPQKISVADAIFDLPKMKVVKEQDGKISHALAESYIFIKNHTPRYHNKRDVEILRELALDASLGVKRKYGTIEALKQLYTQKTGKTSNIHKYFVLPADKPSNTIVSHLHKDGLRHIHPDPNQARSITPREAARLQSFSDDFEFLGSMGDQYKMIGNAVPPKLAFAIASSVHDLIGKYLIKKL